MTRTNTVEQSIAICQCCIGYLLERFIYEKGLFRSPASLTDVRLLQSQMLQGDVNKVRSESDPHIVIGVLQKTLKEMTPSPMQGVYDDILATDISEDSSLSRANVRNWLVKLPPDRFQMASSLFALLQRIATVGGNDSNAMQLAFYVAPFMCRREHSAYMSIRHLEDLRKIRPVIAFVIEHQVEIFRDLKPVPQPTVQPSIPFPAGLVAGLIGKKQAPSQGGASQLTSGNGGNTASVAPVVPGASISAGTDADLRDGRLKPELPRLVTSPRTNNGEYSSLHIPGLSHVSPSGAPLSPHGSLGAMGGGTGAGGSVGMQVYGVDDSMLTASPAHSPVNFNGWEWKIFQSMVQAKVGKFLQRTQSDDELDLDDGDTFDDFDADRDDIMRISKDNPLDGMSASMNIRRFSGAGGLSSSGGSARGNMAAAASSSSSSAMAADSDYMGGCDSPDEDDAMEDIRRSTDSMVCDPQPKQGVPMVTAASESVSRSDSQVGAGPSGGAGAVGGRAAGFMQSSGTAWTENSAVRGTSGGFAGARAGSAPAAATASNAATAGSGKSSKAFGSDRRKMVAECKVLRSQISAFELDFSKTNGRPPKGSERGSMQAVYGRYRDMKREIRDGAAVDIQRMIRGFMMRRRLQKFAVILPYDVTKRSASGGGGVRPRGSGSISSISTGAGSVSDGPAHSHAQPHVQTNTAIGQGSLMAPGHGPPEMSQGQGQGQAHSQIPPETYARYRSLLTQKKDIKRELKLFDEKFLQQHGYMPKKTDKEIMRPLYQRYHEVKAELDGLQAVMESTAGSLNLSMSGVGDSTELAGGSFMMVQQNEAFDFGGASTPQGTAQLMPGSGAPSMNTSPLASSNAVSGRPSIGGGVAPLSLINPNPDIGALDVNALQEEKKKLHAYLKAYEREFSRTHNRPVMRHEDIQPVAGEYQRYKELKAMVKAKKGSSTV